MPRAALRDNNAAGAEWSSGLTGSILRELAATPFSAGFQELSIGNGYKRISALITALNHASIDHAVWDAPRAVSLHVTHFE